MDEVFIDIRNENKWIQKYFTTDFVSIENLLGVIQDLDEEVEELKYKIKELEDEINNPYEEDAYDKWRETNYE